MTWLAQSEAHNIYANGRPDIHSTLNTETLAKVSGAEIGTEFYSLDGAGVKANKWLKTADGWKLVDGDTGWITLSQNPNYLLMIRRDGDDVHVAIDNWSGIKIDLPVGFGFSDWDGTNFTHWQHVQFDTTSDHLVQKLIDPHPNNGVQNYWNYDTTVKNDLQRAVGQVELNPKNELYLMGTYQSTVDWGSGPATPKPRRPAQDLWFGRNITDPQADQKAGGISIYFSFKSQSPYPQTIPTSL